MPAIVKKSLCLVQLAVTIYSAKSSAGARMKHSTEIYFVCLDTSAVLLLAFFVFADIGKCMRYIS
jgi:hypothetical protein